MTSWYVDADKDGFGGTTPTVACFAPLGMIAKSLDCDDARPWVNPDGTELCDLTPD